MTGEAETRIFYARLRGNGACSNNLSRVPKFITCISHSRSGFPVNRRRVWILILMVAGLGGAGRAQTAEGGKSPQELLREALPERQLPEFEAFLKKALEEAPTILMRRWEAEQAVQNARAARAPMLPSATAYVSGGAIFEQRDDGGVKSDRTLAAVLYNAGISQPVFHWGALAKNYDVAKLSRAIAERNADETRRLLAVDLRRRYLELVTVNGSLELARKNLAELNRQLEFAKAQVEAGFAASADSGTITAQITALEISLQGIENDRDMRLYDLSRLTGVPVEQLPLVVQELPKPAELDAAIKALSARDPAIPSARILNAEDTVEAEKLRYEIEKTRLRPKLGVNFSVSQDNRNPDNNALGPKALITTWNAFATVNWQIFDGFAASAAKRASLARLRVYEQDRELAVRQESDTRRADTNTVQLYWRHLQQAEIGLSSARGSVSVVEKDVAAGWIPASEADLARQAADVALQAANVARANFYNAVTAYFSNRGLDPVLQPSR